ncbi:purine-nucleoside phosphorylase [Bdellovibrio bacteriovorus]|uniref:Purine-nucleoside phosphorylase n=1 Tax=Bdellovibrio bacteriovorus TaxID=959 RepID=A0A161PQW3_BDEBC|nr:DUF523 domain-containing protein [Bdellovibrio bacteriovorus]KYG69093.1 purine-nucleoside phosphorylase [Bdellovibrio bacteriovorus]
MKIVSACLSGVHCRYDCKAQTRSSIEEMVKNGEAIPVCPEQLGGLSTPRPPAERIGDKVLTNSGADVTAQYEQGALEALRLAQLCGATEALLKSKSPMCGFGKIYDGTFSGNLKDGDGVFAELLKKHGIKITPVD